MNEVCVNVRPCDIMVNGEIMASILSAFIDAIPTQPDGNAAKSQPIHKPFSESKSNGGPPKASSVFMDFEFPLMYIDFASFRVLLPTCNTNTTSRLADEERNEKSSSSNTPKCEYHDRMTSSGTDGRSLFNPDVFILQMLSFSVAPNADNPLPRVPVNRNTHTSINSHIGSDIEDRQYQLDINDISLCTGKYMLCVINKGIK